MHARARNLWPVLINCILPTVGSCFAVGLAAFRAPSILSNDIGGVPTIWIGMPLLAICVVSVFQSHFNASVSNRIVWPCITVTVAALIVLFALLHRVDGVLCTAPVCGGASIAIAVDDPRLGARLGAPLSPPVAAPPDQPVVVIDQRFETTLYFSMVTFTTLGYGDYQPAPRMRLIASFQALVGYAVLGLIVGMLIDLGGKNAKGTAKGALQAQNAVLFSRRLRRNRSARPRTGTRPSKRR